MSYIRRRANSGRVTYLVYGTLKSESTPTLVLRVRISKTVNNLGTASLRTFAEGLTGVGPPDYSLVCRRAPSRHCAVVGLLFAVVISLLYGSFAPKLRLSQQTCVFTVGANSLRDFIGGIN